MTRRPARWLLTVLLLAGCPGPDSSPPSVTITSPSQLEQVGGTITVAARATDNDRVALVELLVDGAYHASDSTPAGDVFEFELNTAALLPDTLLDLACVAYDPAGNSDTSEVVSIRVRPGTLHSGSITEDQTWRAADNPHIVDGELAVRALLVLEPGIEVQFRPGAALLVGSGGPGALRAAGRADARIRLTANSLNPAPGDWDRVAFLYPMTRDTNLLRHCTVEFGGSGGAMLLADGAGLVVESCSLLDAAGSGVVGQDSGLARLEETDICRCAALPVRVDPMDVGLVGTTNRFADNAWDAVGVNGGAVTANTRWDRRQVPYCVLDFVGIAGPASPALTIAPGCSLFFAHSAGLRIGAGQPGALAANGSNSFIYLGPWSTDPVSGDWQGIEFWANADPVRTNLRNCHVDRAGANGLGAILLFGQAAITGCRVTNSRSNGLNCVGAGFSQFQANEVTGSDSFPLVVAAGAVGTLGTENRLTGNSRDTVAVAPGRVTVSSQWRDHGVPYLVLGEVEVGSGSNARMIVDNGTTLAFASAGALVVGRDSTGILICYGTPDSITFTARRDTAGGWRGIRLYGRAVSTVVDRCRLLNGGSDGLGILYIRESTPSITANEIGWSSSSCVVLWDTPLEPDDIRRDNWLHDWNEEGDYEDIEEGP